MITDPLEDTIYRGYHIRVTGRAQNIQDVTISKWFPGGRVTLYRDCGTVQSAMAIIDMLDEPRSYGSA